MSWRLQRAGGALLSSTWGLGELRWGRGPAGAWGGVEKALNPAGSWGGIIPAVGAGDGVLWGASHAQQKAKGFLRCPGVPQLEMGFTWCRWRWGGMQGIPGEMNQRVNPQPGAQRQLPVRLFPFASTKGKLQELSCCPSPSKESCPWKNGAEGSHGCCSCGTSWCPPNCGCASAQLTPVPGLQELGRRGALSPASLHPSLCPGWKRETSS